MQSKILVVWIVLTGQTVGQVAPVVTLQPTLTETNATTTHAFGTLSIAAAAGPQSWDFMTLGRELMNGRDFSGISQRVDVAAGESVVVPVSVSVVGDRRVDEDGEIQLVYKPANLSWAGALPAPRLLNELGAVQRILSWRKGIVWLVKEISSVDYLECWRRTATGLERLASIAPPVGDPYLFQYFAYGQDFGLQVLDSVDAKLVVFNGLQGAHTYFLDETSPSGWSSLPILKGTANQNTGRSGFWLAGGQLYGQQGSRRWDVTNSQGWSIYGFQTSPLVACRDTMYSWQGAGSRVTGTENLWRWTQLNIPSAFKPSAVQAGMIAFVDTTNPQVTVALEAASGWELTVLNLPPGGGGRIALADRLMAVGRPHLDGSAPGGVQFFLQDVGNPMVWQDAGLLPGSGAGFGSSVIVDGLDVVIEEVLLSRGSRYFLTSLQGAGVRVLDDDRMQLTVHDRTAREPGLAGERLEVEVTLPREARSPVTISYEVQAGTAAAGLDFTGAPGTVTIPAGAFRASIPVDLLADQKAEEAETFRIHVVSVSGGIAPVQDAVITILDANDRQIVTGVEKPVLEGQGAQGVMLRLEPPGNAAPEAVALTVTVAGFPAGAASSAGLPLATAGTDVLDGRHQRTLVPGGSPATFDVAAPQDSAVEPGREVISTIWKSPDVPFIGAGYAPVGLFSGANVTRFAAAGDSVFVLRHPDTGQSSSIIDCYKRSAAGWAKSQEVAAFPLNFNKVRLAADGDNLALVAEGTDGSHTRLLLYRRMAAGWQLTLDFEFYEGLDRFKPELSGDVLRLGDAILLERVSGDRDWRFSADFDFNVGNTTGNSEQQVGFDGDGIAIMNPAQTAVRIYRRSRSGRQNWVLRDTMAAPAGVTFQGISEGRLAGERILLSGYFTAYIFARQGGVWVEELSFPVDSPPFPQVPMVVGFTGQILSTQKVRYVRNGSGPGAWSATPYNSAFVDPPAVLLNEKLLLRGRDGLQMWEPGVQLYVEDDDSLLFSINTLISGRELPGQESIARYQVVSNRPVPVPVRLTVRSQSDTATSGEDFLPIVRELTVFPPGNAIPGSDIFDLPILPDRRCEISETALLSGTQLSFGYMAANATSVIIEDPVLSLATADGLTMREPKSGSFTQFVRKPLGYSTDTPTTVSLQIRPTGTTATAGSDFTVPASITIPAGADEFVIPFTILSDAEVEQIETIQIRVFPGGYLFTVTVLDQTAPGLELKSYSVAQHQVLVADGLGSNPGGLASPGNPSGDYLADYVPPRVTLGLEASGRFTLTPPANFIGDLLLGYAVGPKYDLLSASTTWRYLHPVNGIDPLSLEPAFGVNWKVNGPSALPWQTGSGAISYGGFGGFTGPDLGTPPTGKRYSAYFHTTFEVPAAGSYPLLLRLSYDDAVIVYINGVERGRQGIAPGTAFPAASDSYTLLSGGTGAGVDADEAVLRTVELGVVPLNAGLNHLAVSVHNVLATSSDLGIRLSSLYLNHLAGPTTVRVSVTDALLPPVLQSDAYTCRQTALFQTGDSGTAGLFANDGLLREDGSPHDPITEIIVSPVTAGSLEMIGLTGHFRYTPPVDFAGLASFSYQVRDKDGISLPASVTIQVIPVLAFDVWRESRMPGHVGQSLPFDDDSDGDNSGLLTEYALLGNPAVNDGQSLLSADTLGRWNFSASLRKSADLATIIERTDDLSSPAWKTVMESRGNSYRYIAPGEAVVISAETATSLSVAARFSGLDKQYYRLRISRLLY
jgi:Calx-beta domain/Bacterial Ig domain